MTIPERFAQAARTFVGTPFRLNGRDCKTGLDCVGLVTASLASVGIEASPPTGYALRQVDVAAMLAAVPPVFGHMESTLSNAGDLLLVRPGPAQHHLCILTSGKKFVHAHAGLRRVVEQGGPPPWPVLRGWRLPQTI